MPSLLLEPEQLNACGNGGFLLPLGGDGFQPLPPTGDSRKKKAVGKFVPASARPSPCLRWDLPPPWKLLRWGGFQPLPPTGDSRKKKAVGKFVPASARPSPCLRWICPHLWHFDPLTVISLSPRKSPGVAGALSLTPDGVSDPAASSGPRPSEAIPPVAKQGGNAKRGEGEARKAGERAVTSL